MSHTLREFVVDRGCCLDCIELKLRVALMLRPTRSDEAVKATEALEVIEYMKGY